MDLSSVHDGLEEPGSVLDISQPEALLPESSCHLTSSEPPAKGEPFVTNSSTDVWGPNLENVTVVFPSKH